MKLLYWEYYRKVKERSLFASIFKNLSLNLIIFFQIINIFVEIVLSGIFCNYLVKGYLGFIIEFVILLLIYIIDLRTSSTAVKASIENNNKQDYLKTMFNIDYRQYIRNTCLVELIYNVFSTMAIYVCLLYYMMSFLFKEKSTILITVVLFFSIGTAFELFFIIWINKTKHTYIIKLIKIVIFIIVMTVGQIFSKWILSCPLIDKVSTLEKLKLWRMDFLKIFDIYIFRDYLFMFLKSLVITILLVLISELIKMIIKNNKTEIKLYKFKTNSIFEANLLGIIIISFVFGILIITDTMQILTIKNRLIFELLLVTYGFFYVFDDYLAINNWIYMDYDGNAIHHWLANICLLFKFKEKNYIKRCVLPITMIYIIMNFFIIKDLADILLAVSNLAYIVIIAMLMLYEYNLCVIDKTLRINENYDANKYSDKRIINETGVGFKIMIIGIIYILPVIFFVCGEIEWPILLLSQLGVCLLCLLYCILEKIKVMKCLKDRKWLIALYEEV